MSPKKLIIIASVFFGVLAVGLGIYFAWQKSREMIAPPTLPISPTSSVSFPQNISGSPESQTGTPGQEGIPASKLRTLSDREVFDYWIRQSSTSTPPDVFYLTEKGEIFKVLESVDDELVSLQALGDIQSVKASRDGNWLAVKAGAVWLFNTESNLWLPLSENITSAAFSPESNNKIAYLENAGAKNGLSNLIIRNLIVIKPKNSRETPKIELGKQITKVVSLYQKDFNIKWLTTDKILLISKPSSRYEGEIWSVNVKKKTISLLASGKGLSVNFADDASWGLKFSVDATRTSHLQLIDKDGNSKANLDFITLPDKCLATLSLIYCAVPQNTAVSKYNLPDDFLKRAVYFNDFIYRIDVNQNTSETIYSSNEPVIDAYRFLLFDNRLFFINRYDNKLYQLGL